MDPPVWAAAMAGVPLVLLAALVLSSRPITRAAWVTVLVATALALGPFGLDVPETLLAGLRGLWTGTWILLIVLPALLLYEVLDRSTALDHLAGAAERLAPTEGRRLLLLAWVLPSFLQGAAGFGAPIAMSAPMLVRRGMTPVAAVAACMIGYQWSVTFGSMGSSYFMAEATARLAGGEARSFALRASMLLAVTAVVSGFLVLSRGRRSPGDAGRALGIGVLMGATLIAVVHAQPALGSISAGLVGLAACWWLLPERGGERPGGSDLAVAAAPYAILTVAASVGFAVAPVRALLDRVPELAPVLPGVDAAFGHTTPQEAVTPTLEPLLHPLPYIVLATMFAIALYRRRGWWPRGTGTDAVRGWLGRSRSVTASILGLTVLAAIMTESGMVAAIAGVLATAMGKGFVLVSGPLGALGTVVTGSTTTSNALFASLQAQVAAALAISPAILLSSQTAGGNIGNALAPSVAAVGSASVGVTGQEGTVLRRNISSTVILLALVFAGLALQVWVAL